MQDLKAFGRRMRLREFFYDPEADEEEEYDRAARRFKEKSTWTPHRNREAALEAYLQEVEADAWRLTGSIRRKDNLTPEECRALSNLQSRANLIIKPADKGSATVVMSKEMYMTEAQRQLSDPKYYQKLTEDPTRESAGQVAGLVGEMADRRYITEDARKYLTPTDPRTARFYHTPKIHKMVVPVPGRPIISCCGPPQNGSRSSWTTISTLSSPRHPHT